MYARVIHIIALIFLPLFLVGCLWPLEQVEETKRRGDIIRVALQHHLERFGSYPAELRELVPDTLTAIPPPTVGRKRWEGQENRGQSQVLTQRLGGPKLSAHGAALAD